MNNLSLLEDARKARRSSIRMLRQQQRSDATCLNEMRRVLTDRRTELLNKVAEWLTGFDCDRLASSADKLAFGQAGVSIDEWRRVQIAERQARLNLEMAKNREREAERSYDNVASFGFISIWFMDGEEKLKTQELRLKYQAAKNARETAEAALHASELQIRSFAETFLRASSSADGLNQICKHPDVGAEVQSILNDTATDVQQLWTAHAHIQIGQIGELQSEIEKIATLYARHERI